MARHDVLILSSPDDVHYHAIDWALRNIGVRSALLFGNCFPGHESQSFAIDDEAASCEVVDARGERIDLLAPPVIWYRRAHWPLISTELAAADRGAALREAETFVEGVRSLSASRQHWINHPDRERVATRKPYQLHVARQLGLKIPPTLMSNDPERIREFCEAAKGGVVLKPFHTIQWVGAGTHFLLFSNKIRFEEIEDPEALRLTSHILQHYVEKRYELRVFHFGGKVLAFKLDSQSEAKTRTDWRASSDGSLRPEPYDLPEPVVRQVVRYAEAMGLDYGAFDFIVTPDGDYVFLECNVSGQFLFVEEWNPEVRILADFVHFLTADLALSTAQRSEIDRLRFEDMCYDPELRAHYNAISAGYPEKAVSKNVHHESIS